MSAFIVDRELIDLLVTAHLPYAEDGTVPDEVGRMLWRENLRSVAYRYPGDVDGMRPGPANFRDGDVESYVFRLRREGKIGEALDSYQSCKHREWEASDARRFCVQLAGALDWKGVKTCR